MHQVKRAALGLVLLLGLGTGAAEVAAQSWQGSLALGVEVQNDQKQAVPGARVLLEYAEVEPYDGPQPVTTDESGQAAFYGLAEGLWRVQVEREGYSRYLAVVRLDAKKKKIVVTAGPLRDATAPPLTVDYSKTEARRVAPQVEERRDRDRRAERRRSPREEPREREEPAEEPRPRAEPGRRVEPEPEDRAEPAEPAPAEAEPTPAPQEPEEPREPREPEEPEPEPQPEPEPRREPGAYEVVPAPAPEPEPAGPEPAPAPEMKTPPPEASPEPEAQPTLPPSPMRSAASGTCSDCKPGEAAVSARFRAAAASTSAGATGCPPDVDERVRDAIEAMAAAPVPEADDYVGPLVDQGRVLPWAEPAAVAEAQRLLDPWVTPGSSCQVALVVLSPNVKFTGYRYQAADAQAGGDCLAGQECPIGEARWPEHPRIEKTDAGTFVFSTFENRSSGWERRGEMTVYFEP